jgi:hypothetical protein
VDCKYLFATLNAVVSSFFICLSVLRATFASYSVGGLYESDPAGVVGHVLRADELVDAKGDSRRRCGRCLCPGGASASRLRASCGAGVGSRWGGSSLGILGSMVAERGDGAHC